MWLVGLAPECPPSRSFGEPKKKKLAWDFYTWIRVYLLDKGNFIYYHLRDTKIQCSSIEVM